MLGIGSGSFDPETLVILETAFDEAWITLKTNGSGNIRPDELARRICHLAIEGERDPVRLHDRALGELIPATGVARSKLSKIGHCRGFGGCWGGPRGGPTAPARSLKPRGRLPRTM
jgi:hypothetical protein